MIQREKERGREKEKGREICRGGRETNLRESLGSRGGGKRSRQSKEAVMLWWRLHVRRGRRRAWQCYVEKEEVKARCDSCAGGLVNGSDDKRTRER